MAEEEGPERLWGRSRLWGHMLLNNYRTVSIKSWRRGRLALTFLCSHLPTAHISGNQHPPLAASASASASPSFALFTLVLRLLCYPSSLALVGLMFHTPASVSASLVVAERPESRVSWAVAALKCLHVLCRTRNDVFLLAFGSARLLRPPLPSYPARLIPVWRCLRVVNLAGLDITALSISLLTGCKHNCFRLEAACMLPSYSCTTTSNTSNNATTTIKLCQIALFLTCSAHFSQRALALAQHLSCRWLIIVNQWDQVTHWWWWWCKALIWRLSSSLPVFSKHIFILILVWVQSFFFNITVFTVAVLF